MKAMKLTLKDATRHALLPLNCVRVEYPNKPGLGTRRALQKSTE